MPMPFAPDPAPLTIMAVTFAEGFDPPMNPFQVEWDPARDRFAYGITPAHQASETAMVEWLTEVLRPTSMRPSHYLEIGMALDGQFSWFSETSPPGTMKVGTVQRIRVNDADPDFAEQVDPVPIVDMPELTPTTPVPTDLPE